MNSSHNIMLALLLSLAHAFPSNESSSMEAAAPVPTMSSPTSIPTPEFLEPYQVFQFDFDCDEVTPEFCEQAGNAIKSAGIRIATQILFREPIKVEVVFQDFEDEADSFINLAQGLPSTQLFRKSWHNCSMQKGWNCTKLPCSIGKAVACH